MRPVFPQRQTSLDSGRHSATHQPLESVRRLRKVEQIEKRMARLIAGASIVSTAGDTPLKVSIFPRESRNRVHGSQALSASLRNDRHQRLANPTCP